MPYDEPTANLSSIGDHLPEAPILDTTKHANQHDERCGNVMQTTRRGTAEAAVRHGTVWVSHAPMTSLGVQTAQRGRKDAESR